MRNKASHPPSTPEAAKAFRPSEVEFRLMAENIGEVFWFLELDPFRVSYVSPAFERIWGVEAGELYADHKVWERSIHPEDLPAVREAFKKWLEGGSAEYQMQYRVLHADGSVHWISDRGIVIDYDKNGRPARLSGIAVDITGRKLVEEAVRQSERFAKSTIGAIPARLAVLEESGRIISCNEAWTSFECHGCGFPCIAPDGTDYLAICDAAADLGSEEASRYAAGVRGVLSGELARFSMEFPCHSPQEQRWFVAYVTPFLGDGPRRAVIAHLDISQRKRAEQVIRRLNDELEKRVEERTAQLRESNENLRREIDARLRLEEEILEISEREQQRIGRDLHDDLGQQIVGVWYLGKVLQNNLESAGRPEAVDAAKMTDILERALKLTRNLSRGLQPVALEAGGFSAALKDLATRTTDFLGIPCQFHEDASGFAPDNTTATHLYRIAQEAVTNAVKHADCTRVDLDLTSADGVVALSITDDGRGMTSPAGSSAGMGLRTMRYRADMIGGDLSISPASPHGTVITCLLHPRMKKPRT